MKNEDVLILIVDNDPGIRHFLHEVTSSWGMKAESVSKPPDVSRHLKESFYNLVLLDSGMVGASDTDLVSEVTALSPSTKIIIISAGEEKQATVEALHRGAFGFLEKPLNSELLSHSINRALATQKIELEYQGKDDDLKQSRDELLNHKKRLEELNRELMETNRALSVLAQNIERARQETEKEIVLKIRALISPIISELQQDQNLRDYQAELITLKAYVEDLSSGLGAETKAFTTLSSAELRIASLIKNGLSTEAIANHLYISPETVKTHRKNIRRKLNINNSQHNLKSYLQLKLGNQTPARMVQ